MFRLQSSATASNLPKFWLVVAVELAELPNDIAGASKIIATFSGSENVKKSLISLRARCVSYLAAETWIIFAWPLFGPDLINCFLPLSKSNLYRAGFVSTLTVGIDMQATSLLSWKSERPPAKPGSTETIVLNFIVLLLEI